MKSDSGRLTFPHTYGGGIGIKRRLYTLCGGSLIHKSIRNISCFSSYVANLSVFILT